MFKGRATPESTKSFLETHGVNPSQIREFCGIPISSLGMGTYLGNIDEVTDMKVSMACVQAFDHGCNIFDTAINYRGQRAERSLAESIKRAILSGKAKREDFFVSTKGGFIPFEGKPVTDIPKLFQDVYVAQGLALPIDLIGGCHCIAPGYINDQIERSRKNLQLETIDLYYLHNPEMQLEELPERIFYDNLFEAFLVLERAVKENRIAAYGIATWDGLRVEATSTTSLQIEKCFAAAIRAAEVTGNETHGFKAVQLPLNLAMPEGALVKTQKISHHMFSAIDAAETLGLSVATSVPLLQARLCHDLPDFIVENFPSELSQAHCALAFATAFPGISSAMVGMKSAEHVAHDLEFLKKNRLTEPELRGVVESMISSKTTH